MPTLVIPKTYRARKAPRVADLDNIRLTLESFFNSTKLDDANINLAAISSAMSATQSKTLIASSEVGQITSTSGINEVAVTVPESAVYIIYLVTDNYVIPSATAVGDASGSAEIRFYINSIQVYNFDVSTSYKTSFPPATFTSSFGGIDGKCFARSLTEGDLLELEGNNAFLGIHLIKLVEL